MTVQPSTSRTGTVPVAGGELWFELAGTPGAGPDVVLAHPGSLDSRIWDEAFADLARDHRVLRFDARGHGRSTTITGDYRAHEDLLAVVRHAGLDRPVVVGNSLGGLAAIDLALEHPDDVAGLVLVGPGLSGYTFRYDALAWRDDVAAAGAAAFEAVRRGEDPAPAVAALVETILRGEVDGSHRTPDQVDPALRARLAGIVREEVTAHHGNAGELLGAGALDRLAEIRTPLLLVVGDLDFRDLLEIADVIAAGVPQARKVVLEGVGHMVQNERPEEFHRLVRAFLAGIGTRPVPD